MCENLVEYRSGSLGFRLLGQTKSQRDEADEQQDEELFLRHLS